MSSKNIPMYRMHSQETAGALPVQIPHQDEVAMSMVMLTAGKNVKLTPNSKNYGTWGIWLTPYHMSVRHALALHNAHCSHTLQVLKAPCCWAPSESSCALTLARCIPAGSVPMAPSHVCSWAQRALSCCQMWTPFGQWPRMQASMHVHAHACLHAYKCTTVHVCVLQMHVAHRLASLYGACIWPGAVMTVKAGKHACELQPHDIT